LKEKKNHLWCPLSNQWKYLKSQQLLQTLNFVDQIIDRLMEIFEMICQIIPILFAPENMILPKAIKS